MLSRSVVMMSPRLRMVWFMLVTLFGAVIAVYREFERVPPNITVIEGTTAELHCKVSEGYQSYPVYWEIDGRAIYPNTTDNRFILHDYSSHRTHYLKIMQTMEGDEGGYRCVVDFKNNVLGKSTLGMLTVIQIPIPTFVRPPESKTVFEGGNVTLSCHVGNFSDGKLNVVLVKDGLGILSRNNFIFDILPGKMDSLRYSIQRVESGVFNLQISDVSSSDAGDYRCLVSVVNGNAYILQSQSSKLSVVKAKPTCSIEGTEQEFYEEGDNITTVCTVRGIDAVGDFSLSLSWSIGGLAFPGTQVHVDSTDIRDTWTLTANDDDKPVLCIITQFSDLPTESELMPCVIGPIRVHFAPKVTIHPLVPIVTPGRNLTLTCSSRANPEVQTYRWFVNNAMVTDGDTRYVVSEDDRNITIQRVEKVDDGANITCKAMNRAKSGFALIIIRIDGLKPSSSTLHPTTDALSTDYNSFSENYDSRPVSVVSATKPSSTESNSLSAESVASSTFLIMGCSLIAIITIIVFVLISVKARRRRRGRWRRHDRKVEHGNPRFSEQMSDGTRFVLQSESNRGQDFAFTDFSGHGCYNVEMNFRSNPVTFSTFVTHQSAERADLDIASPSGEQKVDIIYARVNEERKSENSAADGSDETGAAMTTSSSPYNTEIESVDARDEAKSVDDPRSHGTDSLVYAELDLVTPTYSNRMSPKENEHSTVYAELRHPVQI